MSKNPWWPAGVFALIFFGAFVTSPLWAADMRIVDGDTVHIDGEKIRVLGIDTPEKGHQADCIAERMLSDLATARLTALLDGAEITLERDGLDKYGRTLAIVRADGRDVAEVLIEEGYGRVYEGKQVDWCG